MHKINNQKGHTLLEMVVAVAIFSVLFLMITNIYLMMTQNQNRVIATQNIQESMKFVFEMISKEMRTARKSDNTCSTFLPAASVPDTNNKVYNTADSGAVFYFENKDGQCVVYLLEAYGPVGGFKIIRDTEEYFVTPDELNLENMHFFIWDDAVGDFHSDQPFVTMRVDVEDSTPREMNKLRTRYQTTISSRYYE